MPGTTGWRSAKKTSLTTAVLTCALGLLFVQSSGAEEETTVITCPSIIEANGFGNTHWVEQFLGPEAPKVPFESAWYEYKRGNAASGRAWYWPYPRTTTWSDLVWEWTGAGVEFTCHRAYFPPVYFDVYTVQGIEGNATVIPDAAGPNVGETESWYPGTGYIGGGGETNQIECYDIWIMEYVELPNGILVLDVYDSGYEVCYQDGNMT